MKSPPYTRFGQMLFGVGAFDLIAMMDVLRCLSAEITEAVSRQLQDSGCGRLPLRGPRIFASLSPPTQRWSRLRAARCRDASARVVLQMTLDYRSHCYVLVSGVRISGNICQHDAVTRNRHYRATVKFERDR
jgi:hypothetical protein